ncbi:GNAT family N-acetyltransferase [Paenibacillus filicis]|uniref:GNAT family N-acetyltransferase n=1 Tax=Paenibacillus filicis TaxID=669464 RepID=A0ABU9DNX7_9BACL
MTEEIRLATLADAPAILDLTLRAYAPIRELGLSFPAATADLGKVENNIRRQRTYVLLVDGSIVSTVSISLPEWVRQVIEYPFELPFIWWFATDPEYGGKGIGGRLLDRVEELACRELNSDAVTLSTSTRHPWLVDMYKRRGYETVKETDKGEQGISVIMRKAINLGHTESEKEGEH